MSDVKDGISLYQALRAMGYPPMLAAEITHDARVAASLVYTRAWLRAIDECQHFPKPKGDT